MNVKTVKQTEPRVEYPSIDNLDILSYGHNNLYPQDIKSITACSESGTTCLNRYIQFIQGNGFKDVAFAETVINRLGDTADDILQQVADDLGNYNGFALHVNYNLLGEIVEVNHVPFENTRLGIEDDAGYISKIAVFPDWTGKKKRNKKQLKPTKQTIDYIDVFNPNKSVVLAQIELAGGIENYNGQVLWVSGSGKQEYPKAIYDSVVTQMSTEEGLGNISYKNVRNGLLPAKVMVVKKGLDTPNEESEDNPNRYEDDSLSEALSSAQGDMNSSRIVVVEVEFDEETPQTIDLQGNNYDKDFTVTTDTACEKIYAAFSQEVWHRLRKGSVGFSSDIMRDAYDVYSSVCGSERRMIERAFDKIFKHWHEAISTTDFTVQPLKYVSDHIDGTMVLEMYEKDLLTKNEVLSSVGIEGKDTGNKYLSESTNTPLAVRLGVGGTQALQSILVDTEMSEQAKIGSLEVLFSLTRSDAEKLVRGN